MEIKRNMFSAARKVLLIVSIIFLTGIIFLVKYVSNVYSLGAETAHPHIAREAKKVWPENDPNAPQEAKKEFDKYIEPDVGKGIVQGSTDEDYLGYYQLVPGGAKGYIPALWHYYNLSEPCIGVRAVGGVRSAVDFAEELFSFAVNEYKTGNIEPAYYFLGRIAHLLGDMATPAHVHGDIHSLGKYEWLLSGICTDAESQRYLTPDALDPDLFEIFMEDVHPLNSNPTIYKKKSVEEILEDMANITRQYPSNDYGDWWKFDWKWEIKNIS